MIFLLFLDGFFGLGELTERESLVFRCFFRWFFRCFGVESQSLADHGATWSSDFVSSSTFSFIFVFFLLSSSYSPSSCFLLLLLLGTWSCRWVSSLSLLFLLLLLWLLLSRKKWTWHKALAWFLR